MMSTHSRLAVIMFLVVYCFSSSVHARSYFGRPTLERKLLINKLVQNNINSKYLRKSSDTSRRQFGGSDLQRKLHTNHLARSTNFERMKLDFKTDLLNRKSKSKKKIYISGDSCNSTYSVSKKTIYFMDISTLYSCSFIFRARKKVDFSVSCPTVNLTMGCGNETLHVSFSPTFNNEYCSEDKFSIPVHKRLTEFYFRLHKNMFSNIESYVKCTIRGSKGKKSYKATGKQLCPLNCGQTTSSAEAENSYDFSKDKESVYNDSQPVRDTKIIGGKTADEGEWPWIVYLNIFTDSNFFCGGSLITRSHVLTAGHCVFDVEKDNPKHRVKIVAGVVDINLRSKAQKSIVKKIYMHPNFSYEPTTNDIAILQVKKPFKLNKDVNLLCLAPPGNYEGMKTILVGWGEVQLNEDVSDTLQEITVEVTNTDECAKNYSLINYENPIDNTTICNSSTDQDSCDGDSGGPLIARLGTSWYQVGIISHGEECALENLPGVNTYVPAFLDWIFTVTTEDC